MLNPLAKAVAVAVVAGIASSPVLAKPPVAQQHAQRRKAYHKPDPVSFVRVRDDADGRPAALQVANVTYAPVDGSNLTVTLYGAVHVGDRAYYKQLNDRFVEHEALLFELANDPSALDDRDRGARSPFAMFQMDPGAALGLQQQLDMIDYTRPNFVHADMALGELFDHARAEGEDLLTIATQTLLDVQRMVNRGDDPFSALLGEGQGQDLESFDPFSALTGRGGDPRQLKIQMAQQLASQSSGGILEGITVLDRYLIQARNQRCLEVLDREIRRGKVDLGIFYGAGHNPDFHRRLMSDYALRPIAVEWIDAWDLQAEVAPQPTRVRELSEDELLMELIRRLMESAD